MLQIKDLSKTYPSGVQALKGITLNIGPGMFGLLGPNGAGKSTLMKILATLLKPDSGSVNLNGLNLINSKDKARRILGYLPQEFGLYPTLTASEMLDYFAKLKGIANTKQRRVLVEALLESVNLTQACRQRLDGFSGGMKQRLGIAQALIGDPQLIIVDEPTAGLDPEERARFNNLLAETAGENAVVILSTHIVSDVSNLCNNMAIIRQGAIVSSSTPQQAIDELKDCVWEAVVTREQAANLRSQLQVVSSQLLGGSLRLRVISKQSRPGEEFRSVAPSLEDSYLALIASEEQTTQ